jgi:hypothetical protein
MQEHCDVYRDIRSVRTRKNRRGTGPITPATMLNLPS